MTIKPVAREAIREEDAPFTVESLRMVMIQSEVLKRGMKLPSEEALAEFARILESWRQHYIAEQNIFLPVRELQSEAHTALDKLNAAIGGLKDKNEAFYSEELRDPSMAVRDLRSGMVTVPESMVRLILEKRLREIAEAQKAIDKIACASFLEDNSIGESGWKWLANVLPIDFETAMQSTNPNYKARLSHNGPLPRFIAAVAPFLTGEHPTVASAATQMKTARKKGK